jgi:hypothetical protein
MLSNTGAQVTRRIFVSLSAGPWLPANLNALKWGVVDEIEKRGYTPEIFTNPRGRPGLASAKAWNPSDADDIARRCMGAAGATVFRVDGWPLPFQFASSFMQVRAVLRVQYDLLRSLRQVGSEAAPDQ